MSLSLPRVSHLLLFVPFCGCAAQFLSVGLFVAFRSLDRVNMVGSGNENLDQD